MNFRFTKSFLLFLFLGAISISIKAQSIYFNYTDGTDAAYNLADVRKITFVADEMVRIRATNNIFPELRRFAAERNEFLAYAGTTKLAEALDLTFNALLESEPMPDDPVAFVAEHLRNQDQEELMDPVEYWNQH